LINSVVSGSTIVTFTIVPAVGSSINPAEAVAKLQVQILDPYSVLRIGSTTSGATSLSVAFTCPTGVQTTSCGKNSSDATALLLDFNVLYVLHIAVIAVLML
jgi:hypothetical protein